MKARMSFAALASLALVAGLAGCSNATSSDQASAGGPAGGLKISVVTHGQASDPYWSVVKNGVTEATSDTGNEVTYQAPQKFDMVEMSRLIDAEVA
ncbi:MAG: hypothetical protein ACKOW5_09360, partial [Actinomycetales bacterium]